MRSDMEGRDDLQLRGALGFPGEKVSNIPVLLVGFCLGMLKLDVGLESTEPGKVLSTKWT